MSSKIAKLWCKWLYWAYQFGREWIFDNWIALASERAEQKMHLISSFPFFLCTASTLFFIVSYRLDFLHFRCLHSQHSFFLLRNSHRFSFSSLYHIFRVSSCFRLHSSSCSCDSTFNGLSNTKSSLLRLFRLFVCSVACEKCQFRGKNGAQIYGALLLRLREIFTLPSLNFNNCETGRLLKIQTE